ncbi:hypothetical protein NEPAR04_1793 [Nematocida parisii]|nr:hypothetical protein NEPAR03_1915 [Nematocida parisii]KAI5130322.1 hypothetical protein NEPAR08_1977 [Nematocida parisii]KAI5143321.1 hypothetical protein NEPAR04_1793 [Nematocida parisii]KAI5143767.1 hypothetical protein NEPAR07_0841 [Nematocida parisii]
MQYIDALGNVYRKDSSINRWVGIEHMHILKEKPKLEHGNSIYNYEFCENLPVSAIALNQTDSLAVLDSLDKETSMYVLDTLLSNRAYIPDHKILQCISKEAILECSHKIGGSTIIEELSNRIKEKKECIDTHVGELVEKAVRVGMVLNDDEYAYRTVQFLGISKYLPKYNYMMHSRHIVPVIEYEKIIRYIKKHPLSIYCTVTKGLKSPIDASRLECRIPQDTGTKLYKEGRHAEVQKEIDSIIGLPISVIESVFSKCRQKRRKEIIQTINSTACDVGLKSCRDAFYAEAFKGSRAAEESVHLEINLEKEYARLEEERRILSDTEEGEIK